MHPIFYDKAGYMDRTMSYFHTSPGSACSILMAVYVSGGFEETVRSLPAFDIGLDTLHLVVLYLRGWQT